MNQQNNPSRIRAKKSMRHLLKELADAAEAEISAGAYKEIDRMVDDIIQAAVDQMEASKGIPPFLDEALNSGDGTYRP